MNKNSFSRIKKDFHSWESKRRAVVGNSNEALGLSKRAIFAFHRGSIRDGNNNLKKAEKIFKYLENLSKGQPRLRHEGSWRAALEEYTEAKLFGDYLKNKKVSIITGRQIDTEIFLGALCDFTGELVRYAIKQATEKKFNEVKMAKKTIEEAMNNLIQLNLTGYLRTKYDQAKNNLRKIEQVMYEVSLRK
jgi:predicted translin family RNA/ssDNA-binding protein